MKRCPKCGKDYPDEANFCPVDAGQLEGVAEPAAPNAAAPAVDTAGHELLGGRFSLGADIGGGRTGPVHEANDKQGGPCVVKLVAPAVFPTALLLSRTERELKQLERLESQNVVRLIDHGKRDHTLWIASELFEGVTLERLVADSGPLPEARVLGIIRQIGAGLEDAARLGVIHRDLAPKNVLVGAGDRVKLINFGIPVPGDERVQGVVEYVAPEPIEGRPVDQRCNIYSLGAIAYFALSGAPPFTGDRASVFEAHLRTAPVPLSQRAAVSPSVEAAVLRALEKASAKRFMTLRQFLGDLEASPDSTAPLGMAGPQGKPRADADNNRTLVGMASVDNKNAAAAAASAAGGWQPTPGQAQAAEQAAAQLGGPSPAAPQPHGPPGGAPAQGQPPAAAHPQAPAPAQTPNPAEPMAPRTTSQEPTSVGKGRGKGKGRGEPAEKDSKGKFRETLWFKKGELDEAAAAAAAAQREKDALASDRADEMSIDERYKDDGTVTEQDKDRLSLRTGATMMMEAQRQPAPRGNVSESDLVSEMQGGRTMVIAGIAIGLIAIIVIVALSV